MKKSTLLSGALVAFLFASNVSNGQTSEQRQRIMSSYNQEKLAQLSKTFSKTFQKDLDAAKSYAAANNIPLELRLKNGGIAVLQKVLEDGTLLYTGTENRGAGITVKADKLYPNRNGELNLSLEGEDMMVGVWDGGKVLATHELLGEDRITQVDGSNGLSSHATHVTGTIIGSNLIGDGQARGMAYKASAQTNDFSNDLSEMTQQAAAGLLISNHSYGYVADELPLYYFGRYDEKAAALDNLLFNTPYYTVVSSAGNDRNEGINPSDNGYDLLTDMGVSKNNITVAAVSEVLNYTGPFSVFMSSFSSWGPTDDGRVKPDLCAKGVQTYSSVATSTSSYAYYNGTSMATPSVTGALTLLQELHSNIYGEFMKSSTLKALAIHTVSETGSSNGPDYQYGWGLLNVANGAKVILKEDYQTIMQENTLANGSTFTKSVTALGTEPLVVTVVWNDPSGVVQGNTEAALDDPTPRIVNDLDVALIDASNNITYPWKLNPASFFAAATQGVNNVDNVEKIELAVPSGNYTIRITHKGTLVNGAQDYSLIVSGINESAFVFTPDDISKTFCSDETGEFKFNYESNSTYNGPTVLTATGLPAGAIPTFIPAVITADQDFTLQISGLENVTPGVYSFTVTGAGPGANKSMQLSMKVDSALPIGNTTLSYPGNGETNVFILPTLRWSEVAGASDYKLQISTTSDFSTIVHETITTETSVEVSGLNSNTQYYWRVQPFTGCVNGAFSTSSFTTETLACGGGNFSATDVPQTIIETPTEVSSIINVTQDVLVGDVNVSFTISHTYVADMTISLISPAGTEITLMDGACGDGDDINVTFDDSGAVFSCGSFPAVSGTKKPLEALSAFVGENSLGNWTLKVVDPWNEDGGSLAAFSIQICSTAGNLSVDDAEVEGFSLYPNPAKNYFEFSLFNQQDDMKIGVYDMNGRLLIKKNFDLNTPKHVDVNNLSSGVYFVEITNGNQKGTKKLIVN